MPEESEYLCICRLDGIINAIGNRGRSRFNQIEEDLEGISPKTLTDTLKILQAEQLILRESFNEIPPRVEYSLTRDGQALREAIVPLLRWTMDRDGTGSGGCDFPCRKGPGEAKKVRVKR